MSDWQGWIVVCEEDEEYHSSEFESLQDAIECIKDNELSNYGWNEQDVKTEYRLFKAYEIPIEIQQIVETKVVIKSEIPTTLTLDVCKNKECSRRKK